MIRRSFTFPLSIGVLMSVPSVPDDPTHAPQKNQLSLWDAVSLIVGIVVATSIFQVPWLIFGSLNCIWAVLGIWAIGGALSLIGAFCYAELATTYPRSGGDYVYLTQAYGPFVGFLFGWSHLAGILTGSIGALAFVFATYGTQFFGQDPTREYGFALVAVVGLSLLNVFGIVAGKRTQNLLTILKILGLGGVIVVGIGWGLREGVAWEPASVPEGFQRNWGLALILVLYAFGGWNDASFVAAEVRNRDRNLPLALLGGVGVITVIYLLVNLGYVMGLGYDGVSQSQAPAAAVFQKPFGDWGSQIMRLLVMVSALGGVNGLILTGSRVHASLGADHRLFAWLGRWHPRWDAPIASLVTQAIVSIGLMSIVGTEWGRGQLDALNTRITSEPLQWDNFGGGFELLVATTAPVFWFFFFLNGTAVMALRWKDADRPRPFRVPFYPVLPIVFCGMSIYMFYSSVTYAGTLALVPLVPLVVGIVLYAASELLVRRKTVDHR